MSISIPIAYSKGYLSTALAKNHSIVYVDGMQTKLTEDIKDYFKKEFADILLEKLTDGHELSSFTVNPFLITALSKGVLGEATPLNMAKSLLYPRVFGTSISTTLGDKLQKFCIRMGARASGTSGMDIEFEDKVKNQPLLLQLKAGPNTINSGDVKPIVDDMNSAYRLLRQNKSDHLPTFAVGVLYGTHNDISGHYKKIENSSVGGQLTIPILVGRDFWQRLTGDENFYSDLIGIFGELFEQEDYSKLFEADLQNLANEIEVMYFTNGKFDLKKI